MLKTFKLKHFILISGFVNRYKKNNEQDELAERI